MSLHGSHTSVDIMHATESIHQGSIPINIIFRSLVLRVTANPGSNSSTWTLNNGGSATSLVMLIAGGVTGVITETGNVVFAKDDLTSVLFTHTSDAGAVTLRTVSYTYTVGG